MTPEAHDAIQSLARIAQASARLTARIAATGRAADPDQEVEHMRANLDHAARMIGSAS